MERSTARANSSGEATSENVGATLRRLRREQGLTLRQVAASAELSKSYVSQIENGTANPSLVALKRITSALGLPVAELFTAPESDGSKAAGDNGQVTEEPNREISDEVRVVRKDKRKRLAWPDASGTSYLLTPDLQRKLEVTLDIENPGDFRSTDAYSHEGEEFGFVLEGRYEVTVDGKSYVLEAGDSIYYPSHLPHRIEVLGDSPATTLWVTTPPSF
jgi:transcriptional regulator with XRE-family HTH domain